MRKAFGDLHKRLIHLTSYVSGMVIIGGNNAAAQNRFMRDFISDQDDVVNLAYLQGKASTSEGQYRQQLLTQLLGQAEDDNSSMTQQLGSLLGQQQVLIAISGAEHLSNKLVKDLWHLARNAESIQDGHLNIILTGSQDWAEGLHQYLDGSQLPVFVPYDFSDTAPQVEPSPSELDQMIADKRRAFSERLKARQAKLQEDNSGSTARVGRSKVLVLMSILVFVSCFGGLVWLFYPELFSREPVVASSVGDTEQPASTPAASEAAAEIKPEVSAEENQEPEASEQAQPTAGSASDKVVTDWQTAVKDIKPPEPSADKDSGDLAEPATTTDSDNTEASGNENAPAVAGAADSSPGYAWDERRILQWPEQHYLIQLSAASQSQVISEFRQRHNLSDALRYRTARYGGDWHVLVSAGTYPGLPEARQALSELPGVLQQEGAFIKRIGQVHNEIQQGYAVDNSD